MLCRRCEVEKDDEHFHQHKAYASGRSSWCRECHRAANREWYAANKARQNAKSIKWREANPSASMDADRRYKARNKEKMADAYRKWRDNNRDVRRATLARRKARKLQATPSWASKKEMARIYRLARELEILTGVPMQVDHVVPLQHHLVCGLHCERNLQILPAIFNQSKKNYWWPDMHAGVGRIQDAVDRPDLFIPPRSPEPVQQPLFGGEAA